MNGRLSGESARTGTNPWTRFTAAFAASIVLLALTPAAQGFSSRRENVIVSAFPNAVSDVVHAVESIGGRITRPLSIIDGFAAQIPASELPALRSRSDVRFAELDHRLHPESTTTDTGSLSSVAQIVNAQKLWAAGITGQGVDVALIDTGVAPVPGFQNRLINGPDLSFDYQLGAPPYVDAYGHGTHLAGIIAGRDDSVTDPTQATSGQFVGIAPYARIVNVKVGAFDGAVDVSQVLAGIDWVVQHRHDPGINIRVLNLSYGTDSTQDYMVDPLSYAVDVAWHKGIFVSVAGGNQGSTATSLSDPAYNPAILAVGGSDPKGTIDRSDDTAASWSSAGSATRHVDLVAPGVSIESFNVPGSFAAVNHPTSVLDNGRLIKGSGTSQAAAVVSGVAALLYQAFPSATPDGIKAQMMASAYTLTNCTPLLCGAGEIDANKAYIQGGNGSSSLATLGAPLLTKGTGTLEGARGSAHIQIGNDVLTGEQDIFGKAWDGSSWSGSSWSGSSWSGGMWNGSLWSGSSWSGSSWSGSSWSSNAWDGSSWSGQSWSGQSWSGSSWSGSSWSGQSWSGSSWSGSSWGGSSWSGSSWSGSSWSGQTWSSVDL
ncbi:MAG: S8 family serine peptidase [Actinomycetota bacterium]